MTQPLILTLRLEDEAQAFYEQLRRCYFPPERNRIPAHLTLFHHLPDEPDIRQTLGEMAQATPAFALTNPTLRSLGRGVAVFFQAETLANLHFALSSDFRIHLIPQDWQRFEPHIVVQNKVDSATARQTLEQLQGTSLIEPHATGLTLWRYLGGPWEHVCDYPFRDFDDL